VVLFKIGLEWGVVAWALVAQSGASAGHEVGVVFSDTLLAAPDAPADDGDAAEEDGAAYAADDTANDLLGAGAQSAAASPVAALVDVWGGGEGCLSSGDCDGAAGGLAQCQGLAIADGRDDGRELLDGGGNERGGHDLNGGSRAP
jgi:hypothetical protein